MRPPFSRTIPDLLDEQAAKHPKRKAILTADREITYHEWADASRLVAAGLARLGVSRGEYIALLASNIPEWLFVAFGVARLAAVTTAFSTWSRAWDLEHEIGHSEAGVLILMDRFRSRDFVSDLREMIPEIDTASPGGWRSPRFPKLRHVVVIGNSAPRGAITLRQLMEMGIDGPGLPTAPGIGPSAGDPVYLLYTSGSAARPRGVRLLHYGIIENGFNIGERAGVRPDDRFWLSVPLFWSYGSANATMAALTHGATIVLQDAFEAGTALDLIESFRCTVIYTLPNINRALIEHPAFNRTRTASLRTGLTLGTPDDLRIAAYELAVPQICNIYGMTEGYGNCCVTPHTDPESIRFTTQGPPLPGMEVRILDTGTGEYLPPGEIGEICIRGYVTPGYLRGTEEDNAAFRADGFFRTGDLGILGSDGRLRFQARAKEMIKTGGINVSPLEVEEFLGTYPSIRQAAVVGVPHSVKGEIIAAFLRVEPGCTLDTEELRRWCKERIASFKIPEILEVVEDFPKTDTGKLARRQLRELGIATLARKQQGSGGY